MENAPQQVNVLVRKMLLERNVQYVRSGMRHIQIVILVLMIITKMKKTNVLVSLVD